MGFDFNRFNEMVDLEGIKNDIKEVETDNREFEDVPHGTYEVEIAKLELTATKKEPVRPMLTIWFRVVSGEYKGQMIFYYQQMFTAAGEYAGMFTRFCNEMLESLNSDVEIVFEDYSQYAELITEVAQDIEGKYEYALEYSQNGKGFDQFKIVDVFEV